MTCSCSHFMEPDLFGKNHPGGGNGRSQEAAPGGISDTGMRPPDFMGGRPELLFEVFYLSGCRRTLGVRHEK